MVEMEEEVVKYRISTSRNCLFFILLAVTFLCASAIAELGYTDWVDGSEPMMVDILADIYGGTWHNGGNDYTNDEISALRVYDFDGEEESVHLIDGDQFDIDQIWTDGTATVTAQAKWAGLGQSFGWNGGEGVDGISTDNYYEIISYNGPSGVIEDGPTEEIEITGDFLFGIQPNGSQWWSKMSLNSDNASDHLLTYFMQGLGEPGERVWLLFWEDLPYPGWDQDYQDFVVEIRAAAPVPEPATLCLVGLGGLALLGKRKK
ncbi:MAG: PEP-CTERM sorting domain-containing protein [Planctomycetota bacterium]